MAGIDANTLACFPLDSDYGDIVNSKLSYPKGAVSLSSEQYKWGTGAAYFNGLDGSNALEIDASIQIPNNDDFTIDFQVYLTNRTNEMEFINLQFNASKRWRFWLLSSALRFESTVDGSLTVGFNASNSYLSTNTWHHIAVERYGDDFSIYIDGYQRATANTSNAIWAESTRRMIFGKNPYNPTWIFEGYMDEFRVCNVARYQNASSFTPPSAAYSATTTNISGNLTEASRVLILDDASMVIESNTEEGVGDFEIEVSEGDKTVLVRNANGESYGYGKVTPITS